MRGRGAIHPGVARLLWMDAHEGVSRKDAEGLRVDCGQASEHWYQTQDRLQYCWLIDGFRSLPSYIVRAVL
jgi:hypothetical protein